MGPGRLKESVMAFPPPNPNGLAGGELGHSGSGDRASPPHLSPAYIVSVPPSPSPLLSTTGRQRRALGGAPSVSRQTPSTGYRKGCLCGGACWWAASWLVGSDPVGRWGLELGEILAGSFGYDAVTPAGATIPPWRVSVVFIPLYPPRAAGNPRTRPGSSVVGVAFLPGGAAWYAEDRSLGSWWVDFGGRSGTGSSALCRAAGVGLVSSSFSLACCVARPSVCSVLGVGALEYKAGGNPFSVKGWALVSAWAIYR
ncbi:hypothetical protein VPH35_041883 [Triticum aestivum]|uniref:uncharacterized protein n=1 Tax=Triticum aestivum TaxID=4565 RepID=UPI001D029E4D|nr:uncharacterized protein LOC123059784 [Triticum aestivum]